MKARPINSELGPRPQGGYAQAVELTEHRRFVLISGQIPEDAAGTIPDNFAEQARLAWTNVVHQLHAAEMTVANLVKVTIFLSSRQYALENRQVRNEVLGDTKAALTVIIDGIFDERWLLEIEAIAAD